MGKMQALFSFNKIIQFFGEHALFAGKRELRVPVLHALSPGRLSYCIEPGSGHQDGALLPKDIKMGRARLLCFANAKCREWVKAVFYTALTNWGYANRLA